MKNEINEQQDKKREKRKMKHSKSQTAISRTRRLTWLWNNFLFLIKGLSIIEDFTVGNETYSTVSRGYLKMENLNFSICCNYHTIYYLRFRGNLGWDVSNKNNYRDGSEFYDISYFSLICMLLGYPLTCFVAFHIKWNGINAHLKLIMLILQMQIVCYLQCS